MLSLGLNSPAGTGTPLLLLLVSCYSFVFPLFVGVAVKGHEDLAHSDGLMKVGLWLGVG